MSALAGRRKGSHWIILIRKMPYLIYILRNITIATVGRMKRHAWNQEAQLGMVTVV